MSEKLKPVLSRRKLITQMGLISVGLTGSAFLSGKAVGTHLSNTTGTGEESDCALCVIDNITDLRTLDGNGLSTDLVLLKGGSQTGIGHGLFRWDSQSFEVHNGITVVGQSGEAGRWKRIVQGPYYTSWAGVEESAPDNSSSLQKIINVVKTRKYTPYDMTPTGVMPIIFGVKEISFDADRIRFASTILIDGNIELTSYSSQSGTILEYSGNGHAIVVNSTQDDGFETASQLAQSVTFRALHVKAYNGITGIFVGASTMRDVQFYDGSISGVTDGTGVFLGEAVYGSTFDGFDFYGCKVGLHFNDYCDLITVRNCWIGGNTGAGIIVEGPTYNIENNNFEANSGICIQIMHRTGNRNGLRAGRISGNRFGDEAVPLVPHSWDIEFTVEEGGGTEQIYGTVIENNKFFTGDHAPKQVPIMINGPVSKLTIRGNIQSAAYTSGYLVQATSKAYGPTAAYDSHVDDLSKVSPEARALFSVCDNKGYARYYAADSIQAGMPIEMIGAINNSLNLVGCRTRVAAINVGDILTQRRIVGVADYSESTAGRPVWIRTAGSVVEVDLPYHISNLEQPVYLVADGLSFTPAVGYEPFVVGICVGGSGLKSKMMVLVG